MVSSVLMVVEDNEGLGGGEAMDWWTYGEVEKGKTQPLRDDSRLMSCKSTYIPGAEVGISL